VDPSPETLSPRELGILRLVCESLYPSPPPEPEAEASLLPHSASDLGVAEGFAEAMQRMDGRSRAELRLLLRLLDTPLLPALLLRRPASFTRLGSEERERLLRAMGNSALPTVRSAFQALKRLSAFLFLALPGEEGENPAWEVIGYRPPPSPAPPAPAALRVRTPEREETLEADAVVIGSGAGGGVAAAELARRGMRVVVLEAGGGMQAPDFGGGELAGMRDLFLDAGTTATVDLSVAILAGSTLGGGTTVNWQSSFRTPDEVREEWSALVGRDLAGHEFTRALDAVCARIGVTTGAPVNAVNGIIRDGCEALGRSWSAIPRNERGCEHARCGACTFGCPVAGKQSVAVTYLPDAQRAGAEILVNTRAERVRVEGGRAVGVEAVARAADGREWSVRLHAPLVVAAAGALRTPVLLARSGVSLPALGRNLWLHPVASVAGRFADPVRSWEGAPQTVVGDAFASLDGGYGFRVEAVPAHPGLLAMGASWSGGGAARERLALLGHLAPTIALVRDREGGKVAELRSGGVRIDYRPGRREQAMLRRALLEMCEMQLAAGAEEVYTLHTPELSLRRDAPARARRDFLARVAQAPVARNRSLLFSAHQMGTARMGRHPGDAVCDATGRVFGVRGLYVADASLFPSASGVNPMISVMALAQLVAEAATP
jgi:choline dehydrogenase-like flavoprotein